ncbi:hypothetical protein BS47DRAFT_1391654 [Hydnum rufescens UP504]|uniref:Uncharacterized protein n=1 Tax=Hydnum rufescens UP504 TaxID=1448309 RepID=A0A9P6B0K8_9AGAM|nr:hypothetical protein BS47DRAFT_1391654 [Hydnum rufescens UP504]
MAPPTVVFFLVLSSLVSAINGAPIVANKSEGRDHDCDYDYHRDEDSVSNTSPSKYQTPYPFGWQPPKRIYAALTEAEISRHLYSRDLVASSPKSDDSADILGTISIVAQEAAPSADAIAFGSLVLAFNPAGGNDTSAPTSYVFNVSNSTEPTEFMLHVESSVSAIPNEPDSKTVTLHILSLSTPQASLPSLGTANMTFCAQFEHATTSVSPMSVVPCSSVASNATSQRFLYNSITGFLNPLWTSITKDESAQKRDTLATAAKLVFSPLTVRNTPDTTILDDGGDTVDGDGDSGDTGDDGNDDSVDLATDDDDDAASNNSPLDPSIETVSVDDSPAKVIPAPVQGGDREVWANEDDPSADTPPADPPVDGAGTCTAVDPNAPTFYHQNGLDALAQMDKYSALTPDSRMYPSSRRSLSRLTHSEFVTQLVTRL